MEVLIAIVIVVLVAAFVAVPLRRSAQQGGAGEGAAEAALAALEARKQAKYREIRDTELDRAQGKITAAEFEVQDAELRAEAIAILKRIEELRAAAPGGGRPAESEGGDGPRGESV